uniref:Uncharacterized protein n=1 Tax=Avena sativa TaxID=4498 RepID=A0ACD5UPV5_AVESA
MLHIACRLITIGLIRRSIPSLDSMATKAEQPLSRPARSRTTVQDLPDKLLRRILQLLIVSPLWVVRAAATCPRWRRLIADWRFRSTIDIRQSQDHPLAGSYHNTRNRRGPIFLPSSPDDVDGRHFSLSFLPGGSGAWEIVDSRCSMLLLAKWKTGWRRHCFPDLLVCEPLKRRYQVIPPMEEVRRHRCVGVFLYGCRNTGAYWERNGIGMPAFNLVCLLYQEHDGVRGDHDRSVGTVVACVFDRFRACDRSLMHRKPGWCLRRKERLGLGAPVHLYGAESLRLLGRSGHFVFWSIKEDEESVLRLSSDGYMKIHRLPDIARGSSSLRFIDPGSDYCTAIRAICLQGGDLRVLMLPWPWQWHVDGEWGIQSSHGLLEATRGLTGYKEEYFINGGLEIVSAYGHGRSVVVAPVVEKTWLFTVDLGTMEVARWKHKMDENTSVVSYPCELPWPPDLRACKVPCTKCKQCPCSPKCN